jgi:hypothetical protein
LNPLKNWIVIAAHCTINEVNFTIVAVVGSSHISPTGNQPAGVRHIISKIINHELYDRITSVYE